MGMQQELAKALKDNPTYTLSISADMSYKTPDDKTQVRTFADGLCDYTVCDATEEITAVFEEGELNYSLEELLNKKIEEAITETIQRNTNKDGNISGIKRLQKSLTKEVINCLKKPFSD